MILKQLCEIDGIGKENEISAIANRIIRIVDDNSTLMEELRKRIKEYNVLRIKALQAQINPHFLYNTLDSIIWMIENQNYTDAIKMVTALARLFRISLSKGENIIPLRDEIEHVRNYLTIQSMRYKNKFEYSIDYDEEILDLYSMKLIIQPIVENAIKHGMEFMDGDGEINIKAYVEKDDLIIDVSDNGLGMTEDCVEKILSGEKKSKGNGSGIGLKNVNERIKIYDLFTIPK